MSPPFLDYLVIQASWLFYAFTASATVVLRTSEPSRPRPFAMPFYPLPPLLVTCLAAAIVVSALAKSPLFVILALAFVGAGGPVYWAAVDSSRPCYRAASALSALARSCPCSVTFTAPDVARASLSGDQNPQQQTRRDSAEDSQREGTRRGLLDYS